jgi:ribosomal protein S18 acetylase RimI-like enzyme
LRVVSVVNGYEKVFLEYTSHDPVDYYFFLVDWNQRREQTKILLALEESDSVQGAALLYADYVVQFRGNRNAVETLLEQVNLDKVEMQVPLDCEDIVLRKYKPRIKQNIMLMRLNRGEERIQITENPVRLVAENAEEIAALMRRCDPEWWGEITAEQLKQRWESMFWLGIKKEGKIVSVGNTRFVDSASNIGVVATDEQYRNRGYATSIVSALVQEIFKRSPIALIHVIADNTPAVRAYTRVGYKPHRQYLLIRT